MASYSRKIAFIALIRTIAVSTSTAQSGRWRSSEQATEQYVRDLCSETTRSDDCWKILKPELNRFNSSDDRTTVGAAIDLAIEKSDEIHDKLNQLYQDSKNEKLREKYILCSKNYNDINRNLAVAQQNLMKRNIMVQLKDAEQELNGCRSKFGEKGDSMDSGWANDWSLGKEYSTRPVLENGTRSSDFIWRSFRPHLGGVWLSLF